MTAGTMVTRCPRSAGALDSLVGWRVRHSQWREAPADRGCRPADGESSGLSVGYLPVVRRARVGLLPSRSGRIAMYAAAINRPSPATRSPAGARRSRAAGVVASELGLCRPARPRRSPSTSPPPRAPSSPVPFRNRRPARPEPGQPCSQALIVIAHGDQRGGRNGESDEVPGSCGVPTSGVPGAWHCPRAGSPIRWTTRCSPHRDPRRCQGQAAGRGRRAGRAPDSGA
jgi:hypothetical protein